MDEDFQLSNARARYDFDALRARAIANAGTPAAPFALMTDPAMYRLVRRRPDPTGGNRYVDDYVTPRGDHILVRIATVLDANDALTMLLHYLANSMAPQLPQARERGIELGDLAFTNPGDEPLDVAFTRRNIFVNVFAATPNQSTDDVRRLALEIDRYIIDAPTAS